MAAILVTMTRMMIAATNPINPLMTACGLSSAPFIRRINPAAMVV
jgi:hypothetical protein